MQIKLSFLLLTCCLEFDTLNFLYVKGHGRMIRFASQAEKKAAIMKAADVLEASEDIAGLPGSIGYD